jgi:hypothetical protein
MNDKSDLNSTNFFAVPLNAYYARLLKKRTLMQMLLQRSTVSFAGKGKF